MQELQIYSGVTQLLIRVLLMAFGYTLSRFIQCAVRPTHPVRPMYYHGSENFYIAFKALILQTST